MSKQSAQDQGRFERPTSKNSTNRTNHPIAHREPTRTLPPAPPKCEGKEVLTICIGHAGCALGSKFNEVICNEHGIDPTGTFVGGSDLQLRRLEVFFQEGMGGIYVPRTVLIDMDSGVYHSVRGDIFGQTFRPDNFVHGNGGTANNFAKGYYTDGMNLLEPALDVIRKEAENTDCFQGFQILHAVGGGTGSGFGSLLLEHIASEYPDRIKYTWTIFPSPKISDAVLEPYNAILANRYLMEIPDFVICADNEALFNISQTQLKLTSPRNGDLNHLIAAAMSGVTAAFRFPGQTNHTLRNIATTLVPFPRLHYFVPGFAPLASRANQPYTPNNLQETMHQLFTKTSMLTPCDPKRGTYLACSVLFRGAVSSAEVVNYLNNAHKKSSPVYSELLPKDIQLGFCDVPPRGMHLSASALVNTTAITCMFERLLRGFTALFHRRAFLHWYTSEGMDEGEFMNAEIATQDLVSEYQTHEGKQSHSNSLAVPRGSKRASSRGSTRSKNSTQSERPKDSVASRHSRRPSDDEDD